MKKDIHPNVRPVVFKDISSDFTILNLSAVETNDTITWEDGNEYPLVKVEISSASHPFFTGTQKMMDTEGRVDRFNKRYAAAAAKKSDEE
jgi:large subunit ribosomal protein L31